MPKKNRPRFGSLQYWPRKRARKSIPRVNWGSVKSSEEGLQGFLAYKVGMASAVVKDDTDKSMTKGKKLVVPVTILEIPKMKIFSVRMYKNGRVAKEIIVSNDKILKRKVKLPKETKSFENAEDFDEVRVIIYSVLKNGFKKTPDLAEVVVNSSDKIGFVKRLIGKEIGLNELAKWNVVDVRGLTKGKGLQGPVKRFGITLKAHKSEKGVRNPGSIGPWHPARVTFRVPMAGQLGMFSRVTNNLKALRYGEVSEGEKNINKSEGFKNYGKIQGSYVIVSGSVQGPAKRQLLITPAARPNKKQTKRKWEIIELK